ncbi:TfoX/Sxy family protein [Simiduia aestuariiviva]|uniref:TfoX/Sxy family transcriptional regulator of competence genes n=1 Tax=Simiduia aestuariiviva TaxID=1510459 RepID=A0A839UN49_9GAMM|nr:TfoX/Sxy family protein [Simiduia aestuariiviva]MBB3166877.1 TfoX/Sxy family transcriptional regulator of competence genes [Simiduia aestuariiviva]
MSYSEALVERVRSHLHHHDSYQEKKMFGGLAIMLNGNMCCGVVGEELMARVGPERYEACLKVPYVRQMDFTGKPLRGMVYIAAAGVDSEKQLAAWVELSETFALSLDPK